MQQWTSSQTPVIEPNLHLLCLLAQGLLASGHFSDENGIQWWASGEKRHRFCVVEAASHLLDELKEEAQLCCEVEKQIEAEAKAHADANNAV